jgi:hypothetical protein
MDLPEAIKMGYSGERCVLVHLALLRQLFAGRRMMRVALDKLAFVAKLLPPG